MKERVLITSMFSPSRVPHELIARAAQEFPSIRKPWNEPLANHFSGWELVQPLRSAFFYAVKSVTPRFPD
jgi:hypothetical protein